MNGDELERIQADAQALETLQEISEDTSILPTLSRTDVPPDVHAIPASKCGRETTAVCYRQPTSGIFYAATATGTENLDPGQISLVPFFCYAMTRLGTLKRDFTEVVQRIDAFTGGISLASNVRTRFDAEGRCVPFITINAKCLNRNLEKMLELVQEILFEISFEDQVRLKSLLLEYRAGLESMIIHNGHRYAISLSSRYFSDSAYISELWNGVHQLRYIKDLSSELNGERLESLAMSLADMRRRIMVPANFATALVGEVEPLEQIIPVVSQRSLTPTFEQGSQGIPHFNAPKIDFPEELPREGWATETSVSFVAKTFKSVRMDHADAPGLAVISKMLRSLYLHREIREKGGAYGGFAVYNIENGLFSLASYRDPHILATLEVFDRANQFITSGDYQEEDVKEAILQVCSDIDKPDPPGPAARKAFYRRIISMTDESRRRFKKQLLKLNKDNIVDTAMRYFGKEQSAGGVVVISGEERLRQVNEKIPENLLRLDKI